MADDNGRSNGRVQRLLSELTDWFVEPDRTNEEVVSEIIGRYVLGDAQQTLYRSRYTVRTIDQTIPDYAFWDNVRRGKAKGYVLGALFAKRIEQIFSSWVLGRGADVVLAESGGADNPEDNRVYTDGLVSQFLNDNYSLLLQVFRDMLGLGDQYIVVNMDGTLSVPSPDTVKVERNDLDYREVLAVEITTKLPAATIVDRYEPDQRTVTIKRGQEVVEETAFQNILGRIPVVHLANDRGSNETNGHPLHEELLPLYDQYDDLVFKQIDGAKLIGNPILSFVGLEDLTEVINANDPAEDDTYTDKDGNQDTRYQLNIDQNAVLLVGKGGDAKFVAPPTGFTEDTKTALKSLFLLLLDHTGIPEFIWGNEIASGRSSTEVQMTQWVRDIESRQRNAEVWLLELCGLWIEVTALTDGRVVVDELRVEWPPLVEEDEEIQLKRLDFAKTHGLLTDATVLRLLDLVEDPEAEVEKAQAEAEAQQEVMFPFGTSNQFQGRLQEDSQGE